MAVVPVFCLMPLARAGPSHSSGRFGKTEPGAESVKALRRPSDQPLIQRTPYLHFQVFPVSLNDCSRLTHGSAVPPVPLECPDGACFLFVISDAGIPALGP